MKNAYVLLQVLGVMLFFVAFPFGLILGIILIIIGGSGYRQSDRIKCPSCKELIIKGAKKCRFCGQEI